MATSSRTRRLEPSYKQHTAVCDQAGVIVDVEVTTGGRNEGGELVPALVRIKAVTGVPVATVTANTGTSHAKLYGALMRRGTEAVIPARAESIRTPVPIRRFRYDAKHDRVTCPQWRVLNPGRLTRKGRAFASSVEGCRNCDLVQLCLSPGRPNTVVMIVADYPALLRARRRHGRGSDKDEAFYDRHRWRVKGVPGGTNTCHGLPRLNASRAAWPREQDDPSPSHRRCHQPRAAGRHHRRRAFAARSRLARYSCPVAQSLKRKRAAPMQIAVLDHRVGVEDAVHTRGAAKAESKRHRLADRRSRALRGTNIRRGCMALQVHYPIHDADAAGSARTTYVDRNLPNSG